MGDIMRLFYPTSQKSLFFLVHTTISAILFIRCAFGSPISEVVDKYCQLDYKGARLYSVKYIEIRNLMAWKEDQDEPGWDCFKIISGYRVINEKVMNKTAIVSVEYDILATVWSNAEIDKNSYSDIVDIELLETDSGWKIKQYVTYPRISIGTAITLFEKWIKRWLAEGIEHNEKVSNLRSFIEDLEKLKQKSRAPN